MCVVYKCHNLSISLNPPQRQGVNKNSEQNTAIMQRHFLCPFSVNKYLLLMIYEVHFIDDFQYIFSVVQMKFL